MIEIVHGVKILTEFEYFGGSSR